MNKLIAIIIVNYNGYKDTVECIKSVLKSAYDIYKIILVDNGSNDKGLIEKDKFLLENCDVIFNKENAGFSGGNNIGIKYAKKKYDPDYYLLLNNDTEVESNTIKELLFAFETIPQCGIMTGKILYYNRPHIIWSAGGKFDFKYGIADQPALGREDNESYDGICETSFCTGCTMLISDEVINQVGLLSEDYFLYAEDTDYCCRVVNKNYKLGYAGTARIYHKVSASTGQGSNISQYYNVRNNFYIIKNYSTNRFLGYSKRWYRLFKSILKKEFNVKMVKKGFCDFKKGIIGKVDL